MNLSISNIAWKPEQDASVYAAMEKMGYTGLEIAPTRIFPESPYTHLKEARAFARQLKEHYGLSVCSMQSIWYGRTESLFGNREEREKLLDYTRQAIDFAEALSCPNLVFGCPRNRRRPEGADLGPVLEFFQKTAAYAAECRATFSIEPNPPLYHTNFINTTEEACALTEKIRASLSAPSDREGIAVNLDLGTILENKESLEMLPAQLPLIRHIHISEPGLVCLTESHRDIYRSLTDLVRKAWKEHTWKGFLSIEMACLDSRERLFEVMGWICEGRNS